MATITMAQAVVVSACITAVMLALQIIVNVMMRAKDAKAIANEKVWEAQHREIQMIKALVEDYRGCMTQYWCENHSEETKLRMLECESLAKRIQLAGEIATKTKRLGNEQQEKIKDKFARMVYEAERGQFQGQRQGPDAGRAQNVNLWAGRLMAELAQGDSRQGEAKKGP